MEKRKKFYDYEEEGGTGLMFPRNHFRNMYNPPLSFPFKLEEINSFYSHYCDVYSDSESGSYIWVIGGDGHCHDGEKLGKYEEAVVLYCEPEQKGDLINKIRKAV